MEEIIGTYKVEVTQAEKLLEIGREMVRYVNPLVLGIHKENNKEFEKIVRENYEVETLSKNSYLVKLHIPLTDYVNAMGIASLLPLLFGNTIRSSEVSNIRLLNLSLPKILYSRYQGPRFGLEGVSEKLKFSFPLIAASVGQMTDIKNEFNIELLQNLIKGKVDIIVDTPFELYYKCLNFTQRLNIIFKHIAGKKIIYIANITSDYQVCKKVIREINNIAKNFDVLYGFRICPFSTGISIIPYIKSLTKTQFIYAYSMLTRVMDGTPIYGISSRATATILRMIGADFVSIGSPFEEISDNFDTLYATKQELIKSLSTTPKIHKSIPIITGGITPWRTAYLMKNFGQDIVMHISSGIWHSPLNDIEKSIMAYRQSIELFNSGESYNSYLGHNTKSELSRYLKLIPIEEINKYDVLNKKN